MSKIFGIWNILLQTIASIFNIASQFIFQRIASKTLTIIMCQGLSHMYNFFRFVHCGSVIFVYVQLSPDGHYLVTHLRQLCYLKPIFHCDTKYLASGVGVGQCPRRQNFALEIPTCWYILALPNAKICVFPDANPDTSQWNIGCVGSQCKILALAMYISCFLCRFHLRLEPHFQWNMGLTFHPLT